MHPAWGRPAWVRPVVVLVLAALAVALLPAPAARAGWSQSASLSGRLSADTVDLVTPDGASGLHVAGWTLPPIADPARSRTIYGQVSGPAPEVHSTGVRDLTYRVGSVTARDAAGNPVTGLTAAAVVIGSGTCDAASFAGGVPLLAATALPLAATAAVPPGLAARTLDPGRPTDRICTRLDIADASVLWGTTVTTTWTFLARNAAGVPLPDPADATVPRVTWTRSLSSYVPPPVAPASGPTCTRVPGVLNVVGDSIELHWDWPGSGNGPNPDSFTIYHDGVAVTQAQGIPGSARAWTLDTGLIPSLVNGLFGLSQTLSVVAVVKGTTSSAVISQRVTFVLASVFPLRLASATCAS